MKSPAVAQLAEHAARAAAVRDEFENRHRFAGYSRRQLEQSARQTAAAIAHHDARQDAYSRNASRVFRETLAEIQAEQHRRRAAVA